MSIENQIPKDRGWDNRIQLMLEGYLFIQNRCNHMDTDVFQTKLGGKNVICMSGQEAAEVFYNENKLERLKNLPQLTNKTKSDSKMTIHTLDVQLQEQLFLGLLSPARINELNSLYLEKLKEQADSWSNKDQIVFFDEMKNLLTKVACDWAGIPIKDEVLEQLAHDLFALIDPFESVGLKPRYSKRVLNRVESWIQESLVQVWKEEIQPDSNSTISQISNFQHEEKLLSVSVTCHILIHILKMIVSNAIFITFETLATIQHEEYKRKMNKIDQYDEWFVREVRRYFPFEPFIGAIVRKDFTWEGFTFSKDSLVLLDMYGTNHDPRIWHNPDLFWPERFKEIDFDTYTPEHKSSETDINMLWEQLTKDLMKKTLHFLTDHLIYEVEDHDFEYSLRKMPTMLKTGLVLKNIEKVK